MLRHKNQSLKSSAITLVTTMSVWVRQRGGNEEAFKVDFSGGMDMADLKELITVKRRGQNLPPKAVQSIHSRDDDDEKYRLDPEDVVEFPVKGKIGGTSKIPYYFSLAQTQAGALFLV